MELGVNQTMKRGKLSDIVSKELSVFEDRKTNAYMKKLRQ